ncbi:TonB-linked SusC/RagA family outer membrane protein [Pedobacter cryoconitis]|uniref:TonB-linked SusC/RagA family outer membrane protein n=1 Tax=Pedobacter cryoconitis TaxID=188932 RepID=A0A7W9E0X8_9SPHI|nr:TonB-dependent receptor [Pedobacter cryoconitis]MBB5637090.1 TonB-linked SusC/RagA family outer membrane protein [Pedobacter cryoconitis]MBB6273850.1 TonB-linked SusC/RagA family outer membrane protein [Pedobacter cryoconitis]
MKRKLLILMLFIGCVLSAAAQEKHIKGVVRDAKTQQKLPLSTITIKMKGADPTKMITDDKGNFSLNIVKGAVVEASYIGFIPKQITVSDTTTVLSFLLEDANNLSEVVVIGYGKEKRTDLTSSVSSISAQEISELPVTNLASALASRTPGLEIRGTGYRPGAGTSVNVRGINSITQSEGPLFIVDGVALVGDIRNINPNDIQSVEILKDAAAAGIYGSRAAAGVIIVTTKKGKAGVSTVDFDVYYGIQKPVTTYKMLNGEQYANLRRVAMFDADPVTFPIGTSDAKLFNKYELESIANGYKTYDWQKAITRQNAPMQNYSISVSNGTAKNKVYFSANYLNQDGILINTGYKKYGTFFSLESTLSDKLKLGGSMNLTHDETRNGTDNQFRQSLTQSPLMPIYGEDGQPLVITDNSTGTLTIRNPLTSALYSVNNSNTNRSNGNLYMEFTPIKSLLLRSSLGVDIYEGETGKYYPRNTGEGFSTNGFGEIYKYKSTDVLWENTATYSFTAKNHELNVLGGFTFERHQNTATDMQGTQFPTDLLSYKNIGSAGIKLQDNSNYDGWSVRSLLARAIYKYKGRYIVNVTARQDGSSRFGQNNKFGFFPSASLAWRIIDEPFIGYKFHTIFSDLKLRLSYGLIGNQNLPYDAIYTRYNQSQYPFNGSSATSGYQIGGNAGNESLEWERQHQFNIGTDIALFNNKVQFSADVYNKKISSLLLPFTLAPSSGFYNEQINVAAMNTKGIDLALKVTPVQTKNFTWQASLNWSKYESKVTKLFPGRDSINLALRVGLPPSGTFVNYVYDGLYQQGDDFKLNPNGKPGDIKIKDVNGDGKITPLDQVVVGSSIPKGWGGFWNYFKYKNLSVTIFTTYQYGHQLNNLTYTNLTYYNAADGNTSNVTVEGANYWTPQNTNTNIPRPNAFGSSLKTLPAGPGGPGNSEGGSSYSIQNANYIRIKNISLGYDIPSKFLQKLKVRHLNIYAQAIEPFLFTKYKGLDPDIAGSSGTNENYPRYRTFLLGAKLGL